MNKNKNQLIIIKGKLMNIKQIIIDSLPEEYSNLGELITESIDWTKGDYCLPCFSLSKTLHKSPIAIAEEIKGQLKANEYIQKTEVVAGYINFYLDKTKISQLVIEEILNNGDNAFLSKVGDGKTICIDYSSVNLAKYMHIGHLKNTIVGESLARIFEAVGYKVVRINYIGDYGTPFGKIISAYRLWGSKEDVDKRGIDALQDLYIKFNQEAENNPSLDDMARGEFKKIEQKQEDSYSLYKWVIAIAIKEAERLLDILGVKFDSWRGESYYSEKLDETIAKLESKGLVKESQGALIVDLEKFDMPPCLVRRSDGASLYATRDIAAAIDRFDNYHFDKMFYVTGHEQMLHFKQIFKVLELAGFDFAKNLEHIHYGLFSLPSGKISSRKGKQATLSDLMQLANNKAQEVIKDRQFFIENPNEVARKVAKAVLNFATIKVEVGKDCVFDVDKAFSFDGETAPYMQYSYTRIESILRKFNAMNIQGKADYSVLDNQDAFELLKAVNGVKDSILLAYSKREPSIIVKRAMDICKLLNKFYTTTKVLEGKPDEIVAKINLLRSTKSALAQLFRLMCIDTLQEM